MEKSFPFNASFVNGQYDRVYTAEDFAAERAAYISNGILTADSLSVSPVGGMTVQIAAGMACIGGRTYWNTEPMNMKIESASASLSRIDLLAVRLNLTQRTMALTCITGTYAVNPTAPTPVSDGEITDLPVAQISVPAGTLEMKAANITDLREKAAFPLDVDEIISDYVAELEKILKTGDLESLKKAANVLSYNGDGSKVLHDNGTYAAMPTRRELCRFTTSGTFNPANYPSATGLYDILLLGGGGSGGSMYSPINYGGSGGAAGGMLFAGGVPMKSGTSYAVTVGAGGAAVTSPTNNDSMNSGKKNGNAGGATSMAGFTVPGGTAGVGDGTQNVSGVSVAGFTSEGGDHTHGGSSFLGTGGASSNAGPGGNAAGYGAGGGGGGGTNTVFGWSSGAGGNGLVIIYGY